MAATATSRVIPNYVLAFPHPGLYIPRSITENSTQIAKDLEGIFARILLRYISKDSTPEAITNGQLKAAEELKNCMMIPYDADVGKAKLCDREHHGLMWKKAAPFTSIPLTSMTRDRWKALISTLSNPDKESRPVTEQGYRTNGVFILKHPLARQFCTLKDFIEYLKETDKDSIPLYLGLMKKLPESKDGLHPLTMAFFTPRLLSEEEKALINKHMECPPPGHEISDLMHRFTEQLTAKIAGGEDSIEIAAFAHMQMVIIHPFYDGNGRAARALANFILMQSGLAPVIFISEKDYMLSVETARHTPETFYTFLRAKVEEFARLKDKGTESTMDEQVENLFMSYKKAKTLNALWVQIPLARRIEFGKLITST